MSSFGTLISSAPSIEESCSCGDGNWINGLELGKKLKLRRRVQAEDRYGRVVTVVAGIEGPNIVKADRHRPIADPAAASSLGTTRLSLLGGLADQPPLDLTVSDHPLAH